MSSGSDGWILCFLNSDVGLLVRIGKRRIEVPGLLLGLLKLCFVLLYC